MRLLVLSLLVYISEQCDLLPVLPCNAAIKTCFIHENVCSATDVLFTAFDDGWTFLFVMYPFVNGTRCRADQGVLTPSCLTPTINLITEAKRFPLSIVAQQGMHSSATITTLPAGGNMATLNFSAAPLISTSGLTSVLQLYNGNFIIKNMVIDAGSLAVVCLLSGTANSLTLYNSTLTGCATGIAALNADFTAKIAFVNATLNASPTLAFLLVLSGCINCSVVSSTTQYIALDYNTQITDITVSARAIIFNVSSFVKMTIAIPYPAGPPICHSVSCDQSTLAIAAEAIGIGISCIVILYMIRRHYVTVHHDLKEQ